MDSVSYKTAFANKANIEKKWLIIDAEGMVLGRLSSQVAMILRGKHKPSYTPNADCGDNVIVINADKIRLTGNKWNDKDYSWYTGYPSGQKHLSAKQMFSRSPEKMIEWAVRRMLPKTKLGSAMYRGLHVYKGSAHKHEAQQPVPYTLKYN